MNTIAGRFKQLERSIPTGCSEILVQTTVQLRTESDVEQLNHWISHAKQYSWLVLNCGSSPDILRYINASFVDDYDPTTHKNCVVTLGEPSPQLWAKIAISGAQLATRYDAIVNMPLNDNPTIVLLEPQKRASTIAHKLLRQSLHLEQTTTEQCRALRQSLAVLHKAPPEPPQDLAIVCCYFNPNHYESRSKNYQIFKELIGNRVRVLTVELAFGDDEHELDDSYKLRSPNIMWQKERLLNIGIERLLDEGYDKIAWLDADIIFEDQAWANHISDTLEESPLCQVFHRAFMRHSRNDLGKFFPGAVATGELDQQTGLMGFGWAARASVLRKVQLYDGAILGGGDSLIGAACKCYPDQEDWLDSIEDQAVYLRHTTKSLQHYCDWAARWGAAIEGNVTYVDQSIITLYHGDIQRRQYRSRSDILKQHNFNPAYDIAIGNNGCWEWNSDNPEFHKEVREYFTTRKEDG